MSNKIIFIIGGARSGKSLFALNEASEIKGQKAYIATAEALDDEMRERIKRHKKGRGDEWDTYEEPLKIAVVLLDIKDKYTVVVLDCLTLWLSNILHRAQNTPNSCATGQAEHPEKLPKNYVSGQVRNGAGRTQTTKARTQSTEFRYQIIEDNIKQFIDELATFKNSSPSKQPAGKLVTDHCSLFIVSNEVGMGIVPDNELAREFRDWTGFLNQKVAETADEVYLVTAGIPVKIKNKK